MQSELAGGNIRERDIIKVPDEVEVTNGSERDCHEDIKPFVIIGQLVDGGCGLSYPGQRVCR